MTGEDGRNCQNEVAVLSRLPPHEHLITFHEYFVEGDKLFMVFELAEQGDLANQIEVRIKGNKEPFEEYNIWKFIYFISSALAHMHKHHIWHRDVKPANCFITRGILKLGDLGFGKIMELEYADSLVGTPLYWAPEIVLALEYDEKVDIWSLGCVMYELAMLRVPFSSASSAWLEVRAKIISGEYEPLPNTYSRQFREMVRNMLQRDHRPEASFIMAYARDWIMNYKERNGEQKTDSGPGLSECSSSSSSPSSCSGSPGSTAYASTYSVAPFLSVFCSNPLMSPSITVESTTLSHALSQTDSFSAATGATRATESATCSHPLRRSIGGDSLSSFSEANTPSSARHSPLKRTRDLNELFGHSRSLSTQRKSVPSSYRYEPQGSEPYRSDDSEPDNETDMVIPNQLSPWPPPCSLPLLPRLSLSKLTISIPCSGSVNAAGYQQQVLGSSEISTGSAATSHPSQSSSSAISSAVTSPRTFSIWVVSPGSAVSLPYLPTPSSSATGGFRGPDCQSEAQQRVQWKQQQREQQQRLFAGSASCGVNPSTMPDAFSFPPLAINCDLGDEFQWQDVIGAGKYSQVHRALHLKTGRVVAVKKLHAFEVGATSKRDCQNELDLLQNLPLCPNLIQYMGSYVLDNDLHIVLEYAEDGDLAKFLDTRKRGGQRLRESEIWFYFIQMCEGLRVMHGRRVTHRDIKPSNMFLKNRCRSLKLGDLGLAKYMSSDLDETFSLVGTPFYMCPEAMNERGYNFKSDIWSLGCVLYELAALSSPFYCEQLNLYLLVNAIKEAKYNPLPPGFSKTFEELVFSMLSPSPTDRPDIETVALIARQAQAECNSMPRNTNRCSPQSLTAVRQPGSSLIAFEGRHHSSDRSATTLTNWAHESLSVTPVLSPSSSCDSLPPVSLSSPPMLSPTTPAPVAMNSAVFVTATSPSSDQSYVPALLSANRRILPSSIIGRHFL